MRKWIVSVNLDKDLIIIPESLLEDLLYESHDLRGHVGEVKTREIILQKFWVKNLSFRINQYIKTCKNCMVRKSVKVRNELQSIPKSFFNDLVFVDLAIMRGQNQYGNAVGFMTIVDGFSRFTVLAPIENHDATHLMQVLFKNWISIFGTFANLHSDNEGGLQGAQAQGLYGLLGAHKSRTSAHRPQSDGMAERKIGTTKGILRALMLEEQLSGGVDKDWPSRLPLVQLALNSMPNRFTKISPYMVVFGHEAPIPSSFFSNINEKKVDIPTSVRNLQKKLSSIYKHITDEMDSELNEVETRYSLGAKNNDPLEVGSKVLYRKYNFTNEQYALSPKYHIGHFIVMKRQGTNYIIRPFDSTDSKRDRTVNRDQIQPYLSDEQIQKFETDERNRRAATEARRRLGLLIGAEMNDQI